MTIVLSTLVAGVLGLLFGAGIGYFARQFLASKRATMAESRAQQIINEAKSKSQDLLIEAKDTALKTLEEAVERNPEHPSSRIQLGLTYYVMGQHEKAKTEWLKVLRKRPDDKMAQMYLNLLLTPQRP